LSWSENSKRAAVFAGRIGIALAIVLSAKQALAASAFTLTQTSEGMQVKTPDGRVVFEYKTKVPSNVQSPSAAYFDPVNTPAGERVSNAGPDDHPWHRGIFLGILASEFRTPADMSKAPPNHLVGAYNIKRADFWAWGLYAPKEGRVIKNKDARLVAADDKHAQLEIVNEWTVDGKTMLEETNEVTVAERDGVFVIDLVYKLAPVVDFVLDQTAFGGFVFQAQKYGESYYSNASGKVTDLPGPHYSLPDSDWPSEPWYDYSIKLKSNGKLVGVAILDHPMNPPTRWHNTLWMVNPCTTTFGPQTIHPNAPQVLRYRVVVHDGPPPTDTIQKLSVEWRGMKGNPFTSQTASVTK
jgi:Methane oxygenase PmoA